MLVKYYSYLKKNKFFYSLFRPIVNKIKASKIFWRYRHFVDSKFASGYQNDYSNKRRNYYSDIVNKYSLKIIFEYGCASGPNLKNIQENVKHHKNLIGYDINSTVINYARKTFDKKNSLFINKLELGVIEDYLSKNRSSTIDLTIFDRVLYLLSEVQIKSHLKEFKHLYKYVIIDDFHNSQEVMKEGNYYTKNYLELFGDFNLISLENSEHQINSKFFEENAKRILLCNR